MFKSELEEYNSTDEAIDAAKALYNDDEYIKKVMTDNYVLVVQYQNEYKMKVASVVVWRTSDDSTKELNLYNPEDSGELIEQVYEDITDIVPPIPRQ